VDAYEVSGHASGYAKALAGIVEAFHSLTTVQDIPWRHRTPPARPGQAVTQARQEIHHHSKEEEEEKEEKKKKEKIKMKCTARCNALRKCVAPFVMRARLQYNHHSGDVLTLLKLCCDHLRAMRPAAEAGLFLSSLRRTPCVDHATA